jgi:hypothetical protein
MELKITSGLIEDAGDELIYGGTAGLFTDLFLVGPGDAYHRWV